MGFATALQGDARARSGRVPGLEPSSANAGVSDSAGTELASHEHVASAALNASDPAPLIAAADDDDGEDDDDDDDDDDATASVVAAFAATLGGSVGVVATITSGGGGVSSSLVAACDRPLHCANISPIR